MKNLDIEERVDAMQESNAYITIKDHKPRFPNKIDCRLINPAKSNLGKISKVILDKINSPLLKSTMINQWVNTKQVIDWFIKIEDKDKGTFLKFDVVSFYPSISSTLLLEAIKWARETTNITAEEEDIILNVRKSFLFSNGIPWCKKDNKDFDVTMGSYDGAEICQLVGHYMMWLLSSIIPKNDMGLYRDDGLAVVYGGGPAVDRLRKAISKLFKEKGLDMTIEANLKITEFLDVILDLNTGSYKPFSKPNSEIKYVNRLSNHPPHISKQLPVMIAQRLSDLSSSEEIFEADVHQYNEAIKKSGYQESLKFKKTDHEKQRKQRKQRKRNILWFNPPWSNNIATNIGHEFLKLIDKHFPKRSQFYKYFNRSTIKVSYCCLPNMGKFLSRHNNIILSDNIPDRSNNGECNCPPRKVCPVDGQCMKKSVIYKAEVITNISTKVYLGSTATSWKTRYYNHQSSFKLRRLSSSTTLSNYIWQLKDTGVQYDIKWSIIKSVPEYSKESKRCLLCLSEKTLILYEDKQYLINKRNEIMNKCRHRKKHKLLSFL